PPETLAPLRPSDEPQALVAPPSDEVFPGGSASEPWRAADGDRRLEIDYAAGGAWATADGRGSLRICIDRRPEAAAAVGAPDGLHTPKPFLADLQGVVDQVRRGTVLPCHLDQAVRVRGVGGADHQDQVTLPG